MPNNNALISMAYVSTNSNNPYAIFCEYIKYCIFINPSKKMLIPDIQESLKTEFDIYIPTYIINKCIEDICNEGIIKIKGHQIIRTGLYDTNEFDHTRSEYRDIENSLIQGLIEYVQQFGKQWDINHAREQLIKVLDYNGLAYGIFFNEYSNSEDSITEEGLSDSEILNDTSEVSDDKDIPLFSDSVYVGKYIEKILSEESSQRNYLNKVCSGMMLCAGAYQLSDSNSEQALPQIKGTTFFFDTRLLLRILGCAGEAAVEASHELVNLIQTNGGLICYYPQTYDEIEYAFNSAITKISNDDVIYDQEMLLYVRHIKSDITVLSAKRASFKNELSDLNIYLREHGTYSETERMQYGFDLADLTQYMNANLQWNSRAIENDAKSIWETHMLRKGNYRAYCGSHDHLPVFVTSNQALQRIIMEYRSNRPGITEISNWNKNRLPVITDIRLTCRLWTPSQECDRISLLYLWTNVVAAQKPTRSYCECIKEKANELKKQVPEYSNICLAEFFDDNVTDAVMHTTRGGQKELDIGMFASSISELTELKAEEQKKDNQKIKADRDAQKKMLDDQTRELIDGAVEIYRKKFYFCNIILWVALEWEVVISIIFSVITFIISYVSGYWSILWAILIFVAACIVEKIFSSQVVSKTILKHLIPHIENSYKKEIGKSLRKVEMPYKDEIIKKSIDGINILNKAKKILET